MSTTARPGRAAEQKRLKRDIASSQAASAPAAQPVSTPLAAWSWRGRSSLLAVALALFAGLAVGFFLGWREASPPPLTYHKLTFQRGTIFAARFSPDGQTIFYSAAWNGNPVEVFSVRPAFPDPRPLGIPKTNLAAISSSGQIAITLHAQSTQEVGFSGVLSLMPSVAGAPREIAENVEWADWAPDGTSLAVVRSPAGRYRLEFPVGKVLYETSGWISHSRISPKGDLIAFLDHPAIPDDRGSVMVVDLNGKTRTLSQEYQSVWGLAWSPQEDEIWFTASTEGFARALRTANLAARERLVLKVPGGLKLEDISRDGRFLLTRESTQFGISGFVPGDRNERDLSWRDQSVAADLSSDGGTLLFTEQGEYARPLYAACLRKMDGSSPLRLGDGQALALSPDGRWALSLLLTSPQRLSLLPTDGEKPKLIDRDGIDRYEPQAAWFPDGKRILINADAPGHGARCYVQDIEGKPEPVTPEGTFDCLLSSNGKVVLATHADGMGSLYTLSSGESRTIAGLASGDTAIHFSEDGRSIYTYRSSEVPATISQLDLATGRKTVWKQSIPSDPAGLVSIPRIVVTRNGKSYAYSYNRILSDLYLIEGLK